MNKQLAIVSSQCVLPLAAALRRALRRTLHPPRAILGGGIVIASLAPLTFAAEFPPELPLDSLDGKTGFAVLGRNPLGYSGESVSNAGDINGDGIGDLLIGAKAAGGDQVGRGYVLFGHATRFAPDYLLARLSPRFGGDGSAGFVIRGMPAMRGAGASVSDAGDINGDGIDDLLIGANVGSDFDDPVGAGYVVFGRTTGFPANFDLASLYPGSGGDGSSGFVLQGSDIDYALGTAMGAVGDVNGDGFDDLIVGASDAPNGDRMRVGAAYVVFGGTHFPALFALQSLTVAGGGDGTRGFVMRGVAERSYTASVVDGAGDVNGDGLEDVLIGAWGAAPHGVFHSGAAYVVFGRASGFPAELDLSSLLPGQGGDGSEGFSMSGYAQNNDTGESVAGPGDINADGIDDLLIGARQYDPSLDRQNAGAVYAVFGRRSGFPPDFELHDLLPEAGGDGSEGLVLVGFAAAEQAGRSVSGAGDVDGDGIDDLLIGAPGAAPERKHDAGQSYLVFGRSTAFPAQFELGSLSPERGGDGSEGVILTGVAPKDWSGTAVNRAGDVNADGAADLIVGAFGVDRRENWENVGASYVVFGSAAEH